MTTTSRELRLRLIDAERDANATWPLLAAEGKEQARKLRARIARHERDQIRRDCGLVKVRGNLGGTYWE